MAPIRRSGLSGHAKRVKKKRDAEMIKSLSGSLDRSSGKFLRRFKLPENAMVEEVKAAMENGVLTVIVPKQEIKKPDVKAIQISD